ncbi:MAG TPA: RidA family protein [Devosia sp.]|jgi:enamine deaminase RidA (YjgF/YER057c/UK114 family)|uniref:RidA family protein n=1 Tax=Devosia sp. TaxID=1871048 RepID=UPI002DDCCA1A|nr:RidA family protein [Devosia sp.]HEV2514523.1 RidA family protein [Devosia sp.]
MLTMFNPGGAAPEAPYSHGALVTNAARTLYISGQVGVDATGRMGADIGEQAQIAVANLNAVLAEAGMTPANLAKVTIYLTDDSLIPGFMQAAGGGLPSPPPATTLLVVKALAAPPLLVEIEAIAVA